MQRLVVRNEALTYVLFQRTKYLKLTKTKAFRFLNMFSRLHPFSLYGAVVGVEAKLRSDSLKSLFEDGLREDYEIVKDHLPKECDSVLDIGCGVAGIDCFLEKHYAGQGVEFVLLDKTKVEKKVFYSYRQEGAFYNSLAVARTMLMDNGVDAERIRLVEVHEGTSPEIRDNVDLVISLLSWGFHYPLEVYLDLVVEKLSDRGTLIMDIRRQQDGLAVLKKRFGSVEVIQETPKTQRVCCRR